MFTKTEIIWLSNTARRLHAAQTVAELTEAAIASVHEPFRLVASGCEEVGTGLASYTAHAVRLEVAPPRDYEVFCHDQPLYPLHTSGLPVMHMTRHTSISAWHRTDHYNGVARPVGYNDVLLLIAQTKPSLVMLGCYRHGPFTDHEHALVELLQPHLAAAWRRVRGVATAAQRIGPLRITFSPDLRPIDFPTAAYQLLREYFPDWSSATPLPARLDDWLRESARLLREQPPPHPLHAFTTDHWRGRLLVRCFPNLSDGTVTLILVEVPLATALVRQRLAQLTTREQEVLRWVAAGKRDAEIAVILGLAPTTVHKHVEGILRKLETSSRTAAAARYLQTQ